MKCIQASNRVSVPETSAGDGQKPQRAYIRLPPPPPPPPLEKQHDKKKHDAENEKETQWERPCSPQ